MQLQPLKVMTLLSNQKNHQKEIRNLYLTSAHIGSTSKSKSNFISLQLSLQIKKLSQKTITLSQKN